jgi:hypothetical protein
MPLNQPQPYQSLVYPFGNAGEIQKIDPAMLAAGQYMRLVNFIAWREGALRSRNGYRVLTPGGIEGETGLIYFIHSLFKLYTNQPDPDYNYFYIGAGNYVYRLAGDPLAIVPSSGSSEIYAAQLGPVLERWTGLAYKKGFTGRPYFYLASSTKMLKDQLKDTPSKDYELMSNWGIDRPPWPAQAVGWPGGNLKSLYAKYSYVYTLRNPITGHESNPSPLMLDDFCVETDPDGGNIEVWARPESPDPLGIGRIDPQTGGMWDVVLYRAGGSFSDGLYRRVTILNSAHATPDGYCYFVDNVPDEDIINNPIAEFDNDRPVSSVLPTPFVAMIVGYGVLTGPAPGSSIIGQVEVELDVHTGMGDGQSLEDVLAPGTTILVGQGTDHEEICVVQTVTNGISPPRFVTVFQKDHAAQERVQTVRRANMPCRYAAQAFGCVFLAGDKNNPNTLYKSKPNRPESFPAVVNEVDGSPGAIEVGSSSDPIMNITEFGGVLLCLNKSKIYAVTVYNGAMQAPAETPAQRGLAAPWGWCKANNALFYISYDGVYSFSGGAAVKHSQAIDHIFKGEYSNGFYPISFSEEIGPEGISDLERILMWFYQDDVFLAYRDTDGEMRRIRYSTREDRWSSEDVVVDAVVTEPDTGRVIFASRKATYGTLNQDNLPVTPDAPYTTDGASSASQNDGKEIDARLKLGWMYMGQPAMQKHFGDMVLELENQETDVIVDVFYDFSETAEERFTVEAQPDRGRYRIPLTLNCGLGREAYAINVEIQAKGKRPVALYTLTFHFLFLEEIQRGRASDWDNLGYPHDKRLTQLSLEYDSVGHDVDLNLDITYGVMGRQRAMAVQTFRLLNDASTSSTGPLRVRTTFPIDLDQPVKLVRLRPSATYTDFKTWVYHFDFIQYPPDQVLFTEWEDLGWPCEKLLRELILDIDTGGVVCTLTIEADGIPKRTFQVKTNWDTRHQIITLNEPGQEELIGKLFRLKLTPGTNGKSQLFGHSFNAVRLPCVQTFWSSYEQTFGYNGFKFLKQVWLQYDSCAPVKFRVLTDNRNLLYEVELPQHPYRDVERVYIPVASDEGVLNKSRVYGFELISLDPCCGFRHYADASRVEWMPVGADMRQGYQQFPLMSAMERTQML